MDTYRYLIIGGGMAATAAVDGIREVDPDGSIGIISAECDPPYKRPPLSKGLWRGDKQIETIMYRLDERGVELHLGRKVRLLEPATRSVSDDHGTTYSYTTLLLATGGRPRRLPFGTDSINYFHTLGDYRQLRALADRGKRFAVIGAGFIGTELAAALTMVGKEVVLLFPGRTIGERIYPQDLSLFLNAYYREKGVDVRPQTTVVDVQPHPGGTVVITGDGEEILVDGVVAGVGMDPNIELARQAGLPVQNGIVVDEFLRTGDPHIYAAGDVALYQDRLLNLRRRVEHEDNALAMGRAAGRAMAGRGEPYRHTPFFYSDLFELGYEAVGELDSRLAVVADWQEPYHKGVVYYLADKRVRGVLLWNVWHQVDAARRLIADPDPVNTRELKGRLPERIG